MAESVTPFNTYKPKFLSHSYGVAIKALPVAAVAVAAAVIGWRTSGSLAAPDWLPLAILVALIAATAALARVLRRPPPALVTGAAALLGLAAWTAASIAWAPSAAGARDEALLVALYALVLLVPGLTLAGEAERRCGSAAVAATLGVLGVVSALDVAFAGDPGRLFFFGRLDLPVSYVNAASALFAVGVWPALALATNRAGTMLGRAAATGTAGLFLALGVAAQSKGTILGLAASALAVFAFSPLRLRLLPPLLLAAFPAAAVAVQLTAPYRSPSTAADHRVGVFALVAGAAAFALGALYTVADRRIELDDVRRRAVGRALLALVALALAFGVVAFVVAVPSPGSWLSGKWAAFKHPATGGTSSHLTSLGSNRYDFWRVALDETRRHPVRGIGGRGFYSAYLQHRRSPETPLRAHSLYLDTLSEEGVPGLLLLLVGLGAPLAFLARRLRSPSVVGAFGAAVYFLAHAAVDWIWTIPVVGVVALLLFGIGAAGDEDLPVRRRTSFLAAGTALLLGVFAFAPPWLAYRYVTQAYKTANPSGDLATARSLDPFSLEPDWAEWRLASTPAGRIVALERARALEPDSVAVLYQLGLAYERVGRTRDARTALQRASALDPLDRAVRAAARNAGH